MNRKTENEQITEDPLLPSGTNKSKQEVKLFGKILDGAICKLSNFTATIRMQPITEPRRNRL